MTAILSDPDAQVIVAALGLFAAFAAAGWWRTKQTAKELKPNGGTSLRDAIDRIERKIDLEVIPRLDQTAVVIAQHADRLAVVEDRNAIVALTNEVNALKASTAVTAAALEVQPPTRRRKPS